MATFLFHDKNKSAFINGLNKLFKNNNIKNKISKNDLIDTPSPNKTEFTLYISDDPKIINILKQVEKSKYFDFSFKEINLKEIIQQSKKNLDK